jgi:soluble lytic murein transglycosylase-like protein
MAIDPVTTDPVATLGGVVHKTTVADGVPTAVPFGEVLAKAATPQEPVSPGMAAEMLRLKMLNSALGVGEINDNGRGALASIQTVLDRFLAQLPAQGTSEAAAAQDSGTQGEVCTAEGESSASFPLPTESIIEKASRRYGVDSSLIKAIIKAESDFNPRAVSSAGAQGLMQLMPATARGLGVRDAFDPEQNVMAGTRFLKDMLQRYGNVDEALAAYNWGPGNVDRHGTDRLPRETRAYLGRVKAYYNDYSA